MEINTDNEDFILEENMSFSTIELIEYYKEANIMFMNAMDKIFQIIYLDNITLEDVEFLKGLDLTYSDQKLLHTSYYTFGKEIKKNILEATLSQSFKKAQDIFGNVSYALWNEKCNFYTIKFIQFGVEIDFMLDFIRKLKYYLTFLYIDFMKYVFPSTEPSFQDFFSFRETTEIADEEMDILKKRQIYINAIIESDKLSLVESFDEEDKELHLTFNKKCKKAIEIIDFEIENSPKQITLEQNIEKISGESENKEFTTKRQVLAIYFIFNELGVKNIDKTVQARFIQFLTNKNQSNIYKILSNPFKGLDESNTKIKDDLLYVKNLFDELGLSQLSKKIDANMQI